MLTGFLDWHRQVVANKVEGLSLEQASTVMTPRASACSGS
jgi:hypothetical protein